LYFLFPGVDQPNRQAELSRLNAAAAEGRSTTTRNLLRAMRLATPKHAYEPLGGEEMPSPSPPCLPNSVFPLIVRYYWA